MCISLHYIFVATGFELIERRKRIIKKTKDYSKIKLEYFLGIPYIVVTK